MNRDPVDVDTPPFALAWADVDPEAWPIDAADGGRAIAIDVAFEALMSTPQATGAKDERAGAWRQRAEQNIARALGQRFGPWAGGFRWARDEGSVGGGPVSAWCCASHSIQRADETDLMPSAERAAAALLEWRAWLVRLRELFVLHPPIIDDSGGEDDGARRAAIAARLDAVLAELVATVVEATGAGDAWYMHMGQVLTWYIEHHGGDADLATEAANRAVDGRFRSWIAPADDAVVAAAADWTTLAIDALHRPAG